jgi:hypothetical protein
MLANSANFGLMVWFASSNTAISSFAWRALLGVKNAYAVPLKLQRPVRPMRCM